MIYILHIGTFVTWYTIPWPTGSLYDSLECNGISYYTLNAPLEFYTILWMHLYLYTISLGLDNLDFHIDVNTIWRQYLLIFFTLCIYKLKNKNVIN